jgi:hypothetical protein
MADVKCPKCNATSPAGTANCRACGAAQPAAAGAPAPSQESMYGFDVMNKPPISWGAAGLGVVIILVLQVIIGLTLVPVLAKTFLGGRTPNYIMFRFIVLAVSALIYFAAGYILGRYSKGYLVREPAIAGAVAAIVNGLLNRFVLHGSDTGIVMLLLSVAVCVALGYIGGIAGEQIQQKERERRKGAKAA